MHARWRGSDWPAGAARRRTADQGREAGRWWVSATRSAAPELGNRVRSDRQRRRGRRKSRLVPLRAAPAAERRASPPASRRCRRCRSRTGQTGRSALAVRVLWLRSGRERQAYDRWPRWPFAPAHSLGLPRGKSCRSFATICNYSCYWIVKTASSKSRTQSSKPELLRPRSPPNRRGPDARNGDPAAVEN